LITEGVVIGISLRINPVFEPGLAQILHLLQCDYKYLEVRMLKKSLWLNAPVQYLGLGGAVG
jgi:hypothetical protein